MHTKFKASATECLGVYALVRHWIEREVGHRPELAREIESFQAACHTMDTIVAAKKEIVPAREAAGQLRRALSNWMREHKRCYGENHIIPKHHWMYDICDQLEVDDYVFDQLVVERLHLTVKSHAERCDNMRIFERSVLKGTFIEQLGNLQDLRPDCYLKGKQTMGLVGFPDAKLAKSMDALGMHISVEDVVLHQGMDSLPNHGVVLACVEENDTLYAIVDDMRYHGRLSRHCTYWEPTGRLRVWPALELEQELRFFL